MTATQILKLATQNSITITTAESCTGGLLAAALTELPGSSKIFERGFITYSNTAKIDMLGVSQHSLDQFGAVSETVAQEMATGALQYSGADIAVAVTGIAGPGNSDNKPEGRVCFALVQKRHPPHCETMEFTALGRSNVRSRSVRHALRMILSALS